MLTDDRLEKRISRLEKVLSDAGLFRKLGEPIYDAVFLPDKDGRNASCWRACFSYRCSCEKIHETSELIPPRAKDPAVLQVVGPCGLTDEVTVWFKPPAAL